MTRDELREEYGIYSIYKKTPKGQDWDENKINFSNLYVEWLENKYIELYNKIEHFENAFTGDMNDYYSVKRQLEKLAKEKE